MITSFAVAYVSNGYIYYALTYLEKWPDFTCHGVEKDKCNVDFYKEHRNEPNLIEINYDSVYSLDNWV
jgi:hypothetical protein